MLFFLLLKKGTIKRASSGEHWRYGLHILSAFLYRKTTKQYLSRRIIRRPNIKFESSKHLARGG